MENGRIICKESVENRQRIKSCMSVSLDGTRGGANTPAGNINLTAGKLVGIGYSKLDAMPFVFYSAFHSLFFLLFLSSKSSIFFFLSSFHWPATESATFSSAFLTDCLRDPWREERGVRDGAFWDPLKLSGGFWSYQDRSWEVGWEGGRHRHEEQLKEAATSTLSQ